jgi:MFS family permease
VPVNRRLIAIYTVAAFYAGIAGALFTQTTALASLDVFSFERSADLMLVLVIGGTGYLYGGLIGAVVFKMLQEFFSTITPQYWQFWIGLVLVVIVLVGRDRMHRWALWLPNLVIRQIARRKAVGRSSRSDADDRAGNEGTGEILRRLEGHARSVAAGEAGRPPRPDRAERRRQDHRHQPPDRRAQAQCGTDCARGQRHH